MKINKIYLFDVAFCRILLMFKCSCLFLTSSFLALFLLLVGCSKNPGGQGPIGLNSPRPSSMEDNSSEASDVSYVSILHFENNGMVDLSNAKAYSITGICSEFGQEVWVRIEPAVGSYVTRCSFDGQWEIWVDFSQSVSGIFLFDLTHGHYEREVSLQISSLLFIDVSAMQNPDFITWNILPATNGGYSNVSQQSVSGDGLDFAKNGRVEIYSDPLCLLKISEAVIDSSGSFDALISYTGNGLDDGTKYFYSIIYNQFGTGNPNGCKYTGVYFNLDTMAPVLTTGISPQMDVPSQNDFTGNPVAVFSGGSFSGEEGGSFKFYEDSNCLTNIGQGTIDAFGALPSTNATLITSGLVQIYGTIVDLAQNSSNCLQLPSATFTLDYISPSAPSIVYNPTSIVTVDQVGVNWGNATDNVTSTGNMRYQVKACADQLCSTDCVGEVLVSGTSTTLKNLVLGNEYYICAEGVDEVGNVGPFGVSTATVNYRRANLLEQYYLSPNTDGEDIPMMNIFDQQGNMYICGYTDGDFAATNSGGEDIIVAKFDVTGQLLWAKQWGGPLNDRATSCAMATDNNIFVAVATQSVLDANPNAGGYDVALMKIDQVGNLIFITQVDGIGSNEAAGAANFSGDDIPVQIVISEFGDPIVVGNTTSNMENNGVGATDVFIMKFNRNSPGQVYWINLLNGTGLNEAAQIITNAGTESLGAAYSDGAGQVYLFGQTDDNFAGLQDGVGGAGTGDVFVANIDDSTGAPNWIEHFDSFGPGQSLLNNVGAQEIAYEISEANDGTLLMMGGTYSNFAELHGSTGINQDCFVLRVDQNTGSLLDVVHLGLTSAKGTDQNDVCSGGLKQDANSGLIYFSGHTEGLLQGNFQVSPAKPGLPPGANGRGKQYFIAVADNNLNFQWALSIRSPSIANSDINDEFSHKNTFTIDNNGIYFMGRTRSNFSLVGNGSSDIFVGRVNLDGSYTP